MSTQVQPLEKVSGTVPSEVQKEPVWIGIVGAANAGKDTVAHVLRNVYPELFLNVSLAKAIKDVAIEYYGMTSDMCWTDEGKAADHPYLEKNDEPISNRHVLELIGDKLQEIDPLVLIRDVERRVQRYPGRHLQGVLVTDLRTEPQVEFIREKGGIIVYVQRPEMERAAEENDEDHHTKTFYKRTDHDFMIENKGSLSSFEATVQHLFFHRLSHLFPRI